MKRLLFLILLCFSALMLAQTSNWTNVKETNINVANALPAGFVDIFTNRYGNHITVQESNNLKYYQLNISGVAESPVTIESSAVVTPSISGDANNIYIVYGFGDQVRVRRSTDGGTNWSLWTYFNLSTEASYIESVVSNEKLHVTYLESNKVRYRFRNLFTGGWSIIHEVSNGETGNIPRITAYKNEQVDFVYFMYSKFNSVDYDCKWRRYNVTNNTWGPLYTAPIENDYIDVFSGFRVDNSNVVIYYRWHQEHPWYQDYFSWAILDLYNNLEGYGNADVNNNINDRMYSTSTEDGNTHTAFYYVQLAGQGYSDFGLWRSHMAEPFPTDEIYEYTEPEDSIWNLNLSSAGNEVHVIWQDTFGSNYVYNLRYKYDDQIPLAPKNLSSYLDPEPYCNNCHGSGPGIRLDWDKNNEPDLSYYTIYRAEQSGNCYSCHGSAGGTSQDSTSTSTEPITVHQECPALSGETTDFSSSKVEVETGCLSGLEENERLIFEPIWAWSQNYWVDIFNIQENYTYFYFVTAKDVTSNESD